MISIRRQLTRELLGAFLLLLGGALAAFYFSARDEVYEQFDATLRAEALAITSLTDEHTDGHLEFSSPFARGFTRDHPRDFFELWRADGTPLARSDSLAGADLPQHDHPPDRARFWNLPLPNGNDGRALTFSFTPPPDDDEGGPAKPAPAPLTLVVAMDRADLDEALTELLSIGLASGVLLLGATLWVVPRVLRRGLQPLDRLAEQAAGINADSLTTRFPTGDLPAELRPIASRLNELLARLESSFERERRFSADLAHELRTPLAELRSLAECALKWPESRDPKLDEETLAIAAQMQAIVTSLLALTRGDQQQLTPRREPADLAELAREVWRPHDTRAHERGLKISWALAPMKISADPALLRSILGNLFANAVDYAPAGGEVSIRLETSAAGVALRITNLAENLDPPDVPKLFDRFWRKEEARSGGRHFGLGLSLASMFAQAMGWTLTATMDARRHLEFTLAGPAATEPAGVPVLQA
jgi:signal transduction histidine kinase